MCGIVGVVSSTPCKTRLIDGLERLEYRGYDSAGVAILQPGVSGEIAKSVGAPRVLREQMVTLESETLENGTVGIGHTRWATHGGVTDKNAHPHQVGRITLVHNGVIENYVELKALLAEKHSESAGSIPHVFSSQTDSEVLSAFLNYLVSEEGFDMDTALQSLPSHIHGTYGLVVIDSEKPEEIWVARSGSPMIIGLGDESNYVASDALALNPYTENFIYLDEGEFAMLAPKSFQVFDAEGNAISKRVEKLPYVSENDGHNGYSSFMAKEIAEQPAVIGRLIRAHLSPSGLKDGSELVALRQKMLGAENIHIIACGTSFNAGLVAKYLSLIHI